MARPYFAYGANMSRQQLIRRGVEPSGPGSAACVADAEVRISFQHRSGFATLLPAVESCSHAAQRLSCSQPHGVVFWLGQEALRKIAAYETGYRWTKVGVTLYDGRRLDATAFVSSPWLILPEAVPPRESYLRLMKHGAKEHGLAIVYQGWMKVVPVAEPGPLPEKYFETPSAQAARYLLLVLGLATVAAYLTA